jgi:hypothetical protein
MSETEYHRMLLEAYARREMKAPPFRDGPAA